MFFKRLLVVPILIFVFMVTMTQDALGIEIPLQCADRATYEIRTSNVIDGCTKNEISLGAGAIFTSNKTPTELNPTLLARFNAAKAAAKRDGVELKLVSGYRSLSRQTYLFNQAVKKYGSYKEAAKWVAPPEISHHPMGLAMDINYPNEPTSAKWLEVNGYKFGLCRTFKNEWWHFEGNIAPGWKCPKMLKDARELLPWNL